MRQIYVARPDGAGEYARQVSNELPRVLKVDRHPATRWANLAMKVGLIVAFALAIGLTPDTVEGKAMGFRAPLFLAPIVIVLILARVRA